MENYKSQIETPNTLRRRSPRRRMFLFVIAGSALLAWGGLLLFTYLVPPRGVPMIAGAFLLLTLALISTFTPLIYLLRLVLPQKSLVRSPLKEAMREAALFSLWAVFNLLLLVLRSWNILALLTSFGIIIVLELLLLGER